MASTVEARLVGPERQTLIEQFIGLLHLPYVAGCALWACVLGLPGIFLANFFDTWDLNRAYLRLVVPRANVGSQLEGLMTNIAFTLLLFYIFYVTRYMRVRVTKAGPELTNLAPEGEDTLRKAFGRVTQPRFQALTITLSFVSTIPILVSWWEITEGFPINRLQTLALYALLSTGFGSLIWVYLGSLTGIYQLGRQPLKLKPYYEDSMLGLRPLGSLSLTLSLAYFGSIGLGLVGIFGGAISPAATFLVVMLSSFVLLGVVLFVLPLESVHRRMLQEKRREQALVRSQFSETFRAFPNPDSEDTRQVLIRMANVQALEAREKKVASIATWPFDTAIIGRLTAIILAVIATIIARFIIVALSL